jgi:hypothetical protein
MNFRATPPPATDHTMRNLRKALSFSLLALLLAACASSAAPSPTPLPTATNTPAPSATNTPAPTATHTPEPSPTLTLPPTPTNTLVPFPGFSRIFEFNKAWIADNQTHFYFLNSQVDMNLYGTIAGEYPITCSPDPKYPNHMECLSDFTDWKNPGSSLCSTRTKPARRKWTGAPSSQGSATNRAASRRAARLNSGSTTASATSPTPVTTRLAITSIPIITIRPMATLRASPAHARGGKHPEDAHSG